MDLMNVPAKFEVRSFTRSWDNSEYLKNFVQSLDMPFKVVDFGTNRKRMYDFLFCCENPEHSKSEKHDLEKKRENVFWWLCHTKAQYCILALY